jgi:hypothetical protein
MFTMGDISPTTFSSMDQHEALLNIIYQNWDVCPPERPLPPNLPPHTSPYTWSLDFVDTLCQLSNLTMNQRDRAYNLIHTYFTERIRENSCHGTNKKICPEIELSDVQRALASMQRMASGRELEVRSGSIVERPTSSPQITSRKTSSTCSQIDIKDEQGKKRKWSIMDEYGHIEGVEDEDDARLAKLLKMELEDEQQDSRNNSTSSTSTDNDLLVPDLPSIQELPADLLATAPTFPPFKKEDVSIAPSAPSYSSCLNPPASSRPTFKNPFVSPALGRAVLNSPFKPRVPSVSPLTRMPPVFPIFKQPSFAASSPVMAASPHLNQQSQQQAQPSSQFSPMTSQQSTGYSLTPWQEERRQSLVKDLQAGKEALWNDLQAKKEAVRQAVRQGNHAQQVYNDALKRWRGSFGSGQF